MIRALVIDDVQRARDALIADLKDFCPIVEVVGQAEGVVSGVKMIKKLKPDLVFLDIQMNDGTGFDLLEILGKITFKIIFTTALDSFAIKAFKFSALDYLLKPIDSDELMGAVKKLETLETSNSSPQPYELLMENIHKIQQHQVKKIALNTQEKVHIVGIDEILRCQSHSNYTLFFLTQNRKILVTKTLKEFEELLGEYGFLRVHHSHLIHLDQASEFIKTDGGYLIMKDGSQVPVSSRKREMVLKTLLEL